MIKISEEIVLIQLTQGCVAIICAEDYELVASFGNWQLHSNGYAVTTVNKKTVWMHRVINNTPKGMFTDHINRIKLDNRRSNLRTVTKSENGYNVGPRNKSKYPHLPQNITWDKSREKYIAGRSNLKKRRFTNIDDALVYLAIPLSALEPLEISNQDYRAVF